MTACGLTISVPKIKFLVMGAVWCRVTLDPIVVGNDYVMSVAYFCYLGFLVESHSGVQMELNTRISHAVSVFEALKRSVMSDLMLSIITNYGIYSYQAAVMGALLNAISIKVKPEVWLNLLIANSLIIAQYNTLCSINILCAWAADATNPSVCHG